jgi:hypothetical protein
VFIVGLVVIAVATLALIVLFALRRGAPDAPPETPPPAAAPATGAPS